MKSAHLSQFAYKNDQAAATLIREALAVCALGNRPSLFVTVSKQDSKGILSQLESIPVNLASATIFGAGFNGSNPWLINSSEI